MGDSTPKLHLDADASSKALQQALLNRGHDVTRTPNEWIRTDANDEQQLLAASGQGRVIFTYTIRDFQELGRRYTNFAGILLAAQRSFSLNELVELLDKALSTTTTDEWLGRVRWLSDWKDK
jgi:hypothetical protein